jgi:hypothetical protein
MSFKICQQFFCEIDDQLAIEEFGITSNKFGIGIGFADEFADCPDSIIIFKKDYYQMV